MEIIKNPAILGFGASVITYCYFEWKKNKDKIKDKTKEKKSLINQLIISLIIGFVIWFMAFCWFELRTSNIPSINIGKVLSDKPMFVKDTLSSEVPQLAVNIPQKAVPDILIDMI